MLRSEGCVVFLLNNTNSEANVDITRIIYIIYRIIISKLAVFVSF